MVMKKEFLLKSPRVWEEIDRYKWIESERLGYDIGFHEAVREWMNRYADAWLKHYIKNKKFKNRIKN